jgi:hypothetical protein
VSSSKRAYFISPFSSKRPGIVERLIKPEIIAELIPEKDTHGSLDIFSEAIVSRDACL